jgi:hypothetical protein
MILAAGRADLPADPQPPTGLNTLAAEVPIYQHDEEGLQGIGIGCRRPRAARARSPLS